MMMRRWEERLFLKRAVRLLQRARSNAPGVEADINIFLAELAVATRFKEQANEHTAG